MNQSGYAWYYITWVLWDQEDVLLYIALYASKSTKSICKFCHLFLQSWGCFHLHWDLLSSSLKWVSKKIKAFVKDTIHMKHFMKRVGYRCAQPRASGHRIGSRTALCWSVTHSFIPQSRAQLSRAELILVAYSQCRFPWSSWDVSSPGAYINIAPTVCTAPW